MSEDAFNLLAIRGPTHGEGMPRIKPGSSDPQPATSMPSWRVLDRELNVHSMTGAKGDQIQNTPSLFHDVHDKMRNMKLTYVSEFD